MYTRQICGIVYRAGSEPGGLDKYDRDIDTCSLILPALEVDAYITQLLCPYYQVEDGTFESNEMTYVYDEDKGGYLVPVTGQVARYYAEVESISRRSGRQIVTVGYIPASSEDLTLGAPTDPVRYMEYVFDDCRKEIKAIKKSQRMADYKAAVDVFFNKAVLVERKNIIFSKKF